MQDAARSTHARKVAKADALIDWSDSAESIQRQVRAFNPTPGAETRLGEDTIKVWEAAAGRISGKPGEILICDARSLVVACGRGSLELRRVQRAGGKPVSGPELARGFRLTPGVILGSVIPVRR